METSEVSETPDIFIFQTPEVPEASMTLYNERHPKSWGKALLSEGFQDILKLKKCLGLIRCQLSVVSYHWAYLRVRGHYFAGQGLQLRPANFKSKFTLKTFQVLGTDSS